MLCLGDPGLGSPPWRFRLRIPNSESAKLVRESPLLIACGVSGRSGAQRGRGGSLVACGAPPGEDLWAGVPTGALARAGKMESETRRFGGGKVFGRRCVI